MLLLGSALTAAITGGFNGPDSDSSDVARAATTTPTTTAVASATATSPAAASTIPDIYDAASPAVVRIDTSGGSGSGFLVDTEGHILTNYHVVAGATTVSVTFPGHAAVDGRVSGTDTGSDLALVTVDVPDGVEPLELGDSGSVRVGETALAIGNPLDRDGTLTVGVVSGVNRSIQTIAGRTIGNAIQTDAPINPGNSGGPLLNGAGQVIGINTQLENPYGQGNIGLGFAVPINTAKDDLETLISGDNVGHPYLGISGTGVTPDIKEQLGLDMDSGVLVQAVVPGGPADKAGIEGTQTSEAGDVIIKLNDTEVKTFEDLTTALNSHDPGDEIEIVVRRGGEDVTLKVVLGEWPAT